MQQDSDSLCVALAQLNFRIGDIRENKAKILDAIHRARSQDADLVIFSEVALLGYPPRDMVDRHDLLARQRQALKEIASQTDEKLAAIVGFIDKNHADEGHRLLNSAAFCARGEVTHTVAKTLLPTYDVFDEWRHFYPAPGNGVVTWKGVKLGISICEDAWAHVQSREMPSYGRDPIAELVDHGAQVLVNIAASPFSLDKGDFRRNLLADHCQRHDCPMIFVNQVGGNDELIFDGRSLALDSGGEVRTRMADFDEDFQLIDISPSGRITNGDDAPIRPVAESHAEQARQAVVSGIRDYVHKSNFDQVLLGLSGGIDSSVSAALAAEALGAENVHGVAMPSRYSSSHSREDARALANNLGIDFSEIPIEAPHSGMLEALSPHLGEDGPAVTEENIQARIRGVYLMALSNQFGKLVLACGNKSELAVGYTTLYGDMCGALAVIGDLPKMLVYAVADLINEEAGEALIPTRILEKPPSAELRPGQRDEDSLPAYEVLDEILERYVVEHRTIEEIAADGFEESTVREVVSMIHRSEFKRWQSPPILKVTTKAFGVGWRYPLAASYRW